MIITHTQNVLFATVSWTSKLAALINATNPSLSYNAASNLSDMFLQCLQSHLLKLSDFPHVNQDNIIYTFLRAKSFLE